MTYYRVYIFTGQSDVHDIAEATSKRKIKRFCNRRGYRVGRMVNDFSKMVPITQIIFARIPDPNYVEFVQP